MGDIRAKGGTINDREKLTAEEAETEAADPAARKGIGGDAAEKLSPEVKNLIEEGKKRGFVTYAPHNFYRGGNEFLQLQRRLYPLKKTMYSIILAQHERHLEWLASLPFVDAKRVGFYGLSYGGFTAIRVPTMLDGYCLSISSGEFNDMARKKVSTGDVYSYPFYPGYEIFEYVPVE
jgi:hypothetical protein